MKYDHYDDSSVDIAVDLINEYGTEPRRAAGHDAEPLPDLGAFLRDHGLDDGGVTEDGAREAQQLADRLHTVFRARNPADAVAAINDELSAVGALPQISGHDGSDWHLHYHASDAGPVERLAAIAAMGLATVLCTGGTRRIGHCDGIACRDVYVDTSRNNRRRFCSDGCANRTHVSAHRTRQRSADSGEPTR